MDFASEPVFVDSLPMSATQERLFVARVLLGLKSIWSLITVPGSEDMHCWGLRFRRSLSIVLVLLFIVMWKLFTFTMRTVSSVETCGASMLQFPSQHLHDLHIWRLPWKTSLRAVSDLSIPDRDSVETRLGSTCCYSRELQHDSNIVILQTCHLLIILNLILCV